MYFVELIYTVISFFVSIESQQTAKKTSDIIPCIYITLSQFKMEVYYSVLLSTNVINKSHYTITTRTAIVC